MEKYGIDKREAVAVCTASFRMAREPFTALKSVLLFDLFKICCQLVSTILFYNNDSLIFFHHQVVIIPGSNDFLNVGIFIRQAAALNYHFKMIVIEKHFK